ncbi:MAG TPA: hypothetical protein VEZ90_16055, partial [Blastocatellia bacterium]|nr:hypothetical protein [Blastocatellia bacterium]
NFLFSFLGSPWPINPVLQPFINVANDPASLVNAVDNALLFGRMPATTRSALMTALQGITDNNQRVLAAIYLTITSGDYLIQR